MERFRRCWAEINLTALKNNLAAVRAKVGRGVGILVPVKADAYGHGMEKIAETAVQAGAAWLGVANVGEAARLRRTLPRANILILGASFPEEAPEIVRLGVSSVVCSLDFVRELDRAARKQKTKARAHVKIDTGMGRIGVWHEEAVPFIEKTLEHAGVVLEGVCSHFPSAEEAGDPFTQKQILHFKNVLEACRRRKIEIPLAHLANSSGLLNYPESRQNLVRPGILAYGVSPSEKAVVPGNVEPLLQLKSRILFLKDVESGRTVSYGRTWRAGKKTRIATVPIGYGDGYSRALSNRAQALVGGRRCPVVGRVTMDQIMVEVGTDARVNAGDEVVLIGGPADRQIRVEEVARWAGTIPYEILTNLGDRIERRYVTSA